MTTKEWNFFKETQVSENSPQPASITEELSHENLEEGLEKIEEHLRQHVKRVIEALLFASCDPLPLSKIRNISDTIIPLKPRFLKEILQELQQEYIAGQRAFKIEEIAQGYLIRTYEDYAPYVELLYRQKRSEKLSQAAMEVLAIIAYKQPITRPQIDAIRGVDSSGSLMQLLERNLVESTGRLDAPGRPALYETTKEFLRHFGLKDAKELPSFESK